jgi:uncharacterized protein (DUF433 family)
LLFSKVGRGVYTVAEASLLTGVNRHRISRWTQGYTFTYHGARQTVRAIIGREIDIAEALILTFADLMEIRFLDAFLRNGVSTKALRVASQRAKELLGRHHPFSTQIFKSDGRTILAEITKETGDKVFLDIVNDQYVFEKVIASYLYSGLDFNELKEPARWWPMGKDHAVVIDPRRSFGAPIVAKSGIPTKILKSAVDAEKSVEFVAKWYGAEIDEVKDAVKFETKQAA